MTRARPSRSARDGSDLNGIEVFRLAQKLRSATDRTERAAIYDEHVDELRRRLADPDEQFRATIARSVRLCDPAPAMRAAANTIITEIEQRKEQASE